MRTGLIRKGSLVAVLVAAPAAYRDASDSRTGAGQACATAEYRQFDFFVGDWDTYDVGAPNKIVARNTVTHMLGGCAIRELYQQTDGFVGESFNAYDASRGVWHQSWITNHGHLLLLDGGMRGDSMVLTGPEKSTDGSSSLVRGVWYREATAVRERGERSSDNGATWKPWFDIVFRPHEPRD